MHGKDNDSINGKHSSKSDNEGSFDELEYSGILPTRCGICESVLKDPLILNCLHIYDKECLLKFEKKDDLTSVIKCPQCSRLSGSVKSLKQFDATLLHDSKSESTLEEPVIKCTVCTEGNEAIYRCIQCAGDLCEQCRNIHKVPMCDECMDIDHKGHVNCSLDVVSDQFQPMLHKVLSTWSLKKTELLNISSELQNNLPDLAVSRDKVKEKIEKQVDKWKIAIDQVKDKLLLTNRELHESMEMKIWSKVNQIGKTLDHIDFATEFTKEYYQKCSNLEMCELAYNIFTCFDSLNVENFNNQQKSSIDFKVNDSCIPELICNQFGKFEYFSDKNFDNNSYLNARENDVNLDQTIVNDVKCLSLKSDGDIMSMLAPATVPQLSPNGSHSSGKSSKMLLSSSINGMQNCLSSSGQIISSNSNNALCSVSGNNNMWNGLQLTPGLDSAISSDLDGTSLLSNIDGNVLNINNHGLDVQSVSGMGSVVPMNDEHFGVKGKHCSIFTPSLYEYVRLRNARCSSMNLLAKWGSMGCELGRLNSPHGFCLGFDEEIVIADTHNHRIQVFNKKGVYISYFGVSGRVDGLLWYPRKVVIIRQSQRYVVCDRGNERSRMQLFSRSGHFVRRIAIRYIDIVAGLAINQDNHIVAVDSVSPSVFVVSEEGELIKWFDCSSSMREPSDVAIHGREYYICDFKAHCVVVFQDDGKFLRRIGGETITDYPNGIDVSDYGDVLVGDSHGNRFHIAVFNRSGELQCEFVCNQTKVSRSCCLKITTEGYVVTLSRSSHNVLVINTLYVC